MSLLVDLMADPLEPGYAQAAARRAAKDAADPAAPDGDRARAARRRHQVVATLALGLTGFALAIAASALRPTGGPTSRAREDLVTRIQQRRSDIDARSELLVDLRAQVDAVRSSVLHEAGVSALTAEVDRLDLLAGAVRMTGRGVVVTLDDAPGAGPADTGGDSRSDAATSGAVLARDIQQTVNALWEAGAEAVDVNGQRLTSTSAITRAGRAVVVGYRPLSRPYVVTAIGPPDLGSRFARGAGGEYLASLRAAYRIRADVADSGHAVVAAGAVLSPRYARSPAGDQPARPVGGTP